MALVKYWLYADQLKSKFFHELKASNPKHLIEHHDELGVVYYYVSGPGAFSSLWFGSLYVVLEGYRELALSEPEIDSRLQSEHVDALRLFRNATFHFQRDAFHPKLLKIHDTEEVEQWILETHQCIGRFLCEGILGIPLTEGQPNRGEMSVQLAKQLVES